MKSYTGRHSLNTTPSATCQNTASWNIHDLVLKIILFCGTFFPPLPLYTICTVFSFTQSGHYRDTFFFQISTLLLACLGVRLSGNATAVIIKEEGVEGWWGGGSDIAARLTEIWRWHGWKRPQITPVWFGGLKIYLYICTQWRGWVWLVDRRAGERSQACREGYGRSMDSFPLVLGG